MPSGVILCTASYDHTIRFWEATSGMCHHTIQFTDSQVNSLQITNDKSMVAGACHHIIRLFSLNDTPSYTSRHHQTANQQTIPQIGTLEGHTANVLTLGFPVDDQWMYSGGEDGCIKLWDLGSMSCQRTYKVKSHVNSLCLHPNQAELISGEENGCLRVWDLTLDQCVCLVNPMIDSIIDSQGGIQQQQQQLQQQDKPMQQTKATELKKDNPQNPVVSNDWTKNNLLTYSAQTGHFLKCGISSVSMSPDGQFVCAANHRGQVFIYKLIKVDGPVPPKNTNGDYDVDSDDDSEENGGVSQVTKLQFVTHFEAHTTYILKIQISPDCSQLATCSADSTVKLWDLNNISPGSSVHLIRSLSAHKKWVWDCCFSSDSAYLVTCSSDMTAKLWDVARGDCIKEYKGHQKAVVAIALNDMSHV
jgi:WD40 repeat protein